MQKLGIYKKYSNGFFIERWTRYGKDEIFLFKQEGKFHGREDSITIATIYHLETSWEWRIKCHAGKGWYEREFDSFEQVLNWCEAGSLMQVINLLWNFENKGTIKKDQQQAIAHQKKETTSEDADAIDYARDKKHNG